MIFRIIGENVKVSDHAIKLQYKLKQLIPGDMMNGQPVWNSFSKVFDSRSQAKDFAYKIKQQFNATEDFIEEFEI